MKPFNKLLSWGAFAIIILFVISLLKPDKQIDYVAIEKYRVEHQKTFIKSNIYQLQSDFNEYCAKNSISLHFGAMDIQDGGVGKIYQYPFTPLVHIMGDINESGNVVSCLLLSEGDNTPESAEPQLLAMAALVAINDETIKDRALGDFITGLIRNPSTDGVTRNGINYAFYKIGNVNTLAISIPKYKRTI